jgi:arylformamidase
VDRFVGDEVSKQSRLGSGGWIDVSVRLHNGMVHWPNDPPISITRHRSIEAGDNANVSQISMGSHTGTHMDGPLHFIPGEVGVDDMELEATIGPARVLEIEDPVAVRVGELKRHDIEPGERILLKTLNSPRCWQTDGFVEDFVYIPHEAAEFLASVPIRLVGVDYLSVGGYKRDGALTHGALLGAGIWIIEGLDLTPVTAGDYELVCLPLRIYQSDGAPARAILRPIAG